jgi:hypothetical protein
MKNNTIEDEKTIIEKIRKYYNEVKLDYLNSIQFHSNKTTIDDLINVCEFNLKFCQFIKEFETCRNALYKIENYDMQCNKFLKNITLKLETDDIIKKLLWCREIIEMIKKLLEHCDKCWTPEQHKMYIMFDNCELGEFKSSHLKIKNLGQYLSIEPKLSFYYYVSLRKRKFISILSKVQNGNKQTFARIPLSDECNFPKEMLDEYEKLSFQNVKDQNYEIMLPPYFENDVTHLQNIHIYNMNELGDSCVTIFDVSIFRNGF